MALEISRLILTLVGAWLGSGVLRLVYNVFFHPLREFPGPVAARATTWWKTYIEVVKQESFVDVLFKLHKEFRDVVRIGPNELHFANPAAYNDIYNPNSRWDKDPVLYRSFGEDHSSFGFLTYAESKQRKDVLQPLFSRRSIISLQSLVRNQVDHLAEVLAKNDAEGKSSDMLFAFRSFATDNITSFCFDKSVNAIDEPEFQAPIVTAIDASLPTFHLFKHFPLFRKTILGLPPWLAIKASPETAGLTSLQIILGKQVRDVIANPKILADTEHPTIYHRLLDPSAYKGSSVPDFTNLYEEAQTMMFAGGVTVGDASMTGWFYILSQPVLYQRLKVEVFTVWPNVDSPPNYEVFETLPLLTAAIKESLRMTPGACSPLARVVPASGATIGGKSIPGGTTVGVASSFVHRSPSLFSDPNNFNPDRWLDEDAKGLEQWLIAFSKGPRSCLGLNLAWCELYILYATLLRRFELSIDGTKEEDLVWRDCFTPFYPGRHLRIWCKPRTE